jgi:hypothetical protein
VAPGVLRTLSPVPAVRQLQAMERAGLVESLARTGPPLAVFPYTVSSPRDGATYSGSIVGADPRSPGAGTTNVSVILIPLRVSFTGTTTYNFDPTSPDVGCLGADTAVSRALASPIFTPVSNYLINGVNVGNATFIDAFQRAEFWSDSLGGPLVSANPAYHLGLPVTVAPTQTVSVSAPTRNGAVYTVSGTCSSNTVGQDNPPNLGVVSINYIDSKLKQIIRNLRVRPAQFPLFVIYGAVISNGSATNTNNCCILGYHNGSGNVADAGQTYGIANYDQGYVFSGINDVAILSHEILEWANDPSTSNLVPPWGGIGQVGGCQGNLETGDPLTGTLMPDVTMANGVTYHLQENAFFSWFLGPVFTGAGGLYSSNGSFGGFAKACPPGGTN